MDEQAVLPSAASLCKVPTVHIGGDSSHGIAGLRASMGGPRLSFTGGGYSLIGGMVLHAVGYWCDYIDRTIERHTLLGLQDGNYHFVLFSIAPFQYALFQSQ